MNWFVRDIDPRLTVDCEDPQATGKKVRELLAQSRLRKEALRECTCRMRAIRGEKLTDECIIKK